MTSCLNLSTYLILLASDDILAKAPYILFGTLLIYVQVIYTVPFSLMETLEAIGYITFALVIIKVILNKIIFYLFWIFSINVS